MSGWKYIIVATAPELSALMDTIGISRDLNTIGVDTECLKLTGASIVDTFKVAALNPAEAVGLTDRGEIAVGKRADLVITDHKMNISTVILNGTVCK